MSHNTATNIYNEFLTSGDTLRVYAGGKLVFASRKDRLIPLVEYMDTAAGSYTGVTICDKIMGNAAALLAVKAGAGEVFSPLGSTVAVETLEKYSVKHHIQKVIPYIMKADGIAMCPMEELSIGKTPEEFYQALKARMKKPAAGTSC